MPTTNQTTCRNSSIPVRGLSRAELQERRAKVCATIATKSFPRDIGERSCFFMEACVKVEDGDVIMEVDENAGKIPPKCQKFHYV